MIKKISSKNNPSPNTLLKKDPNKSNKQRRLSKHLSRNLFPKLFVQKPQSKIPK